MPSHSGWYFFHQLPSLLIWLHHYNNLFFILKSLLFRLGNEILWNIFSRIFLVAFFFYRTIDRQTCQLMSLVFSLSNELFIKETPTTLPTLVRLTGLPAHTTLLPTTPLISDKVAWVGGEGAGCLLGQRRKRPWDFGRLATSKTKTDHSLSLSNIPPPPPPPF